MKKKKEQKKENTDGEPEESEGDFDEMLKDLLQVRPKHKKAKTKKAAKAHKTIKIQILIEFMRSENYNKVCGRWDSNPQILGGWRF